MLKRVKEWFLNAYWSWKWKRDLAWRKHTVLRIEKERKTATEAGRKFKSTALRRFVERQPKETAV